MNAIQWATKRIHFSKSSPISGQFNIDRYPFLRKPLLALDNIRTRQIVVYKGASCLGTVFSQLAMCYRLDRRPGDMQFTAQTDDDAKDWSVTRGKQFMQQIPSLMSLLVNPDVKNAITKIPMQNGLYLWPHQFLVITGPGINAQQSKQVRYLHTDESHIFGPGVLAALDNRMGLRWDRASLHVTTAPDQAVIVGEEVVAQEVDVKYHEGQQDEWNQMCPHCNALFWPLWGEYAQDRYNGELIYHWTESQSETETLDSIHAACPHCGKEIIDEPRTRREMNSGGDYVCENPTHDATKESYRWSRLAPDWIPWRDVLSIYRSAMNMARNGDIMPYANFVKKELCMTWRGKVPDIADANITGDYMLANASDVDLANYNWEKE